MTLHYLKICEAVENEEYTNRPVALFLKVGIWGGVDKTLTSVFKNLFFGFLPNREREIERESTNLMGILGGTVKNLDVVMSPSQEINRNWENVIKFPQVGMALKREKSS